MKFTTLLTTTIGVFAIAGAHAGEPATTTLIVEEAPSNALTGDVSVGYDSRYVYRGLWFGDNSLWAAVSLSKQIAPQWTLSGGLFYADIPGDDLSYSEADYSVSLAYESQVGTFTLGAIYYYFFDGFAGDSISGPGGQSDAFEVNLTYSRELFYEINMSLMAAHDFRIDAQYFEAGLSRSWELSDKISLDASAALGYGLNDYYSFDLSGDKTNGVTHGIVKVALPIQMAETVTLTPYVSANFAGAARRKGDASSIGDDEVIYGISLAVSF